MNLTPEQLDLLSEYINVGMGQAATILNGMLGSPIRLSVPKVAVLSAQEASKNLEEMGTGNLSAVNMKFSGNFKGSVGLMFPSSSASALLHLLSLNQEAGPDSDMDAMKSGALTEIGNILLNSVMGNIVNLMKARLDFFIPSYSEDSADKIIQLITGTGDSVHLIMAHTSFMVEDSAVEGCVVIVFEISFIPKLIEALDSILHSL